MQNVTEVELELIFPSPTNPRKYFHEGRLKELADSVKQVGVIQAITIRPHKKKSGKFEIVFGERRWRASQRAEMKTIPANIRELSDDEVQELQFIENLEREDVHPMDEAVTFKAMHENKARPWSLEDIAGKINKPVSYVVQRMHLTRLIDPLQKDFWDGKFLIGHAILFSRLTPADQDDCVKNTRRAGHWGTVKDTQDYVDRNITRQLSAAAFQRTDETLTPVGSCMACPKRSGANRYLFNDIKADDRCFDKKCFEQKSQAWLAREVKAVLEQHPEMILVEYGYNYKVDPSIRKMADDFKVTIYSQANNDFHSSATTGYSSFKALWVSGPDAGSHKIVYKKMAVGAKQISGSGTAPGEPVTRASINVQIGAIKERQQLAIELDGEKVWERVVEKIQDPAHFKKVTFSATALLEEEARAIAWALLEAIEPDQYQKKAFEVLGFTSNPFIDAKASKKLGTVSDKQIFYLLRLFTISQMVNYSTATQPGPSLLMAMLKIYSRTDMELIEEEQQAIADDRLKKTEKKLQQLEEQKKALKQSKEPTAKTETV